MSLNVYWTCMVQLKQSINNRLEITGMVSSRQAPQHIEQERKIPFWRLQSSLLPIYFVSFFTPNSKMSFFCPSIALPSQPSISPQMVGDGCASHGILGALHLPCCPGSCCSQHRAWFICWSCRLSKSLLCPLSCSLTALPRALIQWGFGVGLFVLFIMRQSRKQRKQKLS